ncbi:MAG: hypothetical protein LBS03_11425 [Bacteroidales bacterium]|nr:hypothetical protein [Bacteroidales bacterium]
MKVQRSGQKTAAAIPEIRYFWGKKYLISGIAVSVFRYKTAGILPPSKRKRVAVTLFPKLYLTLRPSYFFSMYHYIIAVPLTARMGILPLPAKRFCTAAACRPSAAGFAGTKTPSLN